MSTLSERLRTGVDDPGIFDEAADELDRLTAELAKAKAMPMKYRRMEFNAQLQEENSRLTARVAELEAEHKVNGLIRAWCDLHNRPIPWAKAVEIVAVIHKMPDAEKARLLSLDDPGRTGA